MVFLSLAIAAVVLGYTYGISVWYFVLIGAAYVAVLAYGSARVSSQMFIPILCHGSEGSKSISLTFDDGPIAGKTERILSILKERGAQAAFFCIGSRIEANPDLARRIKMEGHIIGNHTFSHASTFDLLSSKKMMKELQRTDQAAEGILSSRPRFFRPPYGVTNPMLARAVRQLNYVTVGWTVRSFDTITDDRNKLLTRVTRGLKGGDIVLFHDYCESTIDILPAFLDIVGSKGLNVVRLDQLIGEQPYV